MISALTKLLIEAVTAVAGNEGVSVSAERDEVTLLAPRDQIVPLLTRLRDNERTDFNQLMDVCGVDYPARLERFDVVYHLLSLRKNWRLRVIVRTDEVASVPSVTAVYASAGWFEREVFDLFGVAFSDHPDLRRILTDYDFEGHPLRRDFPLTGFTEVRYDALHRRVVYEPIKLQQDYRAFDALSPWQGMTDVQKRGGGE